jgi:hypothetical protein
MPEAMRETAWMLWKPPRSPERSREATAALALEMFLARCFFEQDGAGKMEERNFSDSLVGIEPSPNSKGHEGGHLTCQG